MDRHDPDPGLRLAWIGTPLRKRLDETFDLPLPWDLARLMSEAEIDPDPVKKNPPGFAPGG